MSLLCFLTEQNNSILISLYFVPNLLAHHLQRHPQHFKVRLCHFRSRINRPLLRSGKLGIRKEDVEGSPEGKGCQPRSATM